MAPHSSTLAWKVPWMEEPGGLQSMGSRRVGHDWETSFSLFTLMHWRRKWQPTPVFLPGESQGWGTWRAAVSGVAQSLTWLKQLSSSSSRYGPLLQLSLTLKLGASILSDETMLSLTASHRRLWSPHLSPGAGAVVSQTRWDSAIAQQWQQPSWHFSVSSVHTLWKITFPVTSLEVQWLRLGLPLQGVQVWSLVRELRSHMLLGQKNQNRKQKQYCNRFNNDFKNGLYKNV